MRFSYRLKSPIKLIIFKRLRTIGVLLFFSLATGCNVSETEKDNPSNSSSVDLFTDITEQVNLQFVHNPGVDGSYFMPESIGSGAAFLDYDNDGDLDIYLVNGAQHGQITSHDPPSRNSLFRQQENGTFVDVTESSGLGDTGYGMGVAVGDIDNDGDVDIYITNYGPDALYRNNGDGTFTEISEFSGINNPQWACSAVFFDYNLDGFLDLFVTNYIEYDGENVCTDKGGRPDYCSPQGFPAVPDLLYANNGDGTFTDISVQSGFSAKPSKGLGVVSADFNGDAYPDLYVANDGEANQLWINQQNGKFEEQALKLGAALNDLGRAEAGMGVAVGDIDNDADWDLFISHLRAESNTLYRYDETYGFIDDTSPSGLAGISLSYTGFGTGFFDYDHDGDLDLAVVNGRVTRGPLLTATRPAEHWDYYAEPNFLFENDGSGGFQNVSDSAPGFCSVVENSRGIAFGDVDNDGDIDLLASNAGGRARLFRNDVKEKGHWLVLRAIDPKLHRYAIGAKITAFVGEHRLYRLVGPGYSFSSSNDPRVHFGLGSATAVDKIQVQWPDGTEETFAGVTADQFILLKKGEGQPGHG